ncbi:uncharacterized protein LOC129883491 [Solanum dulcamara]|uniref:uncharacterized protein LOC129883491 n=1 Tax=Solanum dulcamara TaxID=45834 RepID=UPI002486A7D1|nr:uncharacterized protein LOC129883491 [Solanum dulcamara]
MVGAVILEDVVAKVMVVTSTAGVTGRLELLEYSPAREMVKQAIEPIVMLSPGGLSGVHPVFQVSILKKYHSDGNYIIRWDSILLDKNFSYEEEPIAIFDREVRKLRSREIASVKVQWKNRPVEESIWEIEADMCGRYPHLFIKSGTLFYPHFSFDRSRKNGG